MKLPGRDVMRWNGGDAFLPSCVSKMRKVMKTFEARHGLLYNLSAYLWVSRVIFSMGFIQLCTPPGSFLGPIASLLRFSIANARGHAFEIAGCGERSAAPSSAAKSIFPTAREKLMHTFLIRFEYKFEIISISISFLRWMLEIEIIRRSNIIEDINIGNIDRFTKITYLLETDI